MISLPIIHMKLRAVLWAMDPEDPDVALIHNNLGGALQLQERYAEAEAEHRVALRLREQSLSRSHPEVARSYNNLAGALRAQGKTAEADAAFRVALELWEAALGPEHPLTELARSNLAPTP